MRAAVLCLVLVACDGCDVPSAPAPSVAPPTPEAWTLGATRNEDVVLPPPCRGEGGLAAVMARSTRIEAVPGVVDHVVAVEGTLEPTRGLPAWRPDAAGVMAMAHGRSAAVTALPWSMGAEVARAGPSWLVAREAGGAIALWGEGIDHVLGQGERVIDLFCDGSFCGLLSEGDGARLHLGRADESSGWREVALPAGLRASSIAGAAEGERLVVALADDLRIHLLEVRADGTIRTLAALEASSGGLAAASSPPSALARAGFDPRGCHEEAGGVVLVSSRGAQPLRSALPAETASLVPIRGGALFAAWLAPVRCGASAHALHAVVVGADGSLVGPVTTVAEADGFALASDGDRVALWLEHRAAAAGRGTITWIPMRCAEARP
jgi:hypothetical protein